MKRLIRWTFAAAGAALLIVATILLVRAFDARRQPDLKPWHSALKSEVRARDLSDKTTLVDYVRMEEAVFQELDRTVYPATSAEDRTPASRYWAESPINPERFPKNWNRTFELAPDGEPRGGVLLIHGLTDAPYSVKAPAEIYRSAGFYALALRMPGHGTVPGALLQADREDWRAAVRLGARHVRGRIGSRLPFHVVGYSNGGALALQYAFDALGGAGLPPPSRLVLFSPMIGVSALAGYARIVSAVAVIPYFEKSRWLEILPEYIPFKYGSFPAHAAQQTAELTGAVQSAARKASEAGTIRALPPILAFVSLVDSTVETWATIDRLFAYLGDNGSELTLFDLNRRAVVRPFLRTSYEVPLAALFETRRARTGCLSSPTPAPRPPRSWTVPRPRTRRRSAKRPSASPGRPRSTRSHTWPFPSGQTIPSSGSSRIARSTTESAWACSLPAGSAVSCPFRRASSCG